MRALCASAATRRVAVTAVLTAATLAPASASATNAAPARATSHGLHAAATSEMLLAEPGPLANRLVDANANYAGVGVNGKGTFSLQTNSVGNVSYYSAQWQRTVCGIKGFGLYFDAADAPGIPVDAAGIFVEQYAITYRQGGKRYVVQAIDSAQIGAFAGSDGVTRDMVVFRERVRIRRAKKGAKWCSGTHKKAFVGYRITQGA